MIRIQTNSLPNHCSRATVNIPYSADVDFKMAFNADVNGKENYTSNNAGSSEVESELLCDISRTGSANMLSDSKYE
jgi:hypothetical protein